MMEEASPPEPEPEAKAEAAKPVPGASRGRRGWLLVAAGVVALLVAAILTAIVWAAPRAEACGESPHTGVTASSTVSSDGAELAVAEFGAWSTTVGGSGQLSFGVVMENPSRDTATRITFTYRILDSGGRPAFGSQLSTGNGQLSIRSILPGQRVGLGDVVATGQKVDPAGLQIRVDVVDVSWWPQLNDQYAFTPMPAAVDGFALTPSPDYPGEDPLPGVTVDYWLKPRGCLPPDTGDATVLVRDDSGHIIGGDSSINHTSRDRSLDRTADFGPVPQATATVEVFPQPEPIKLSGSSQ